MSDRDVIANGEVEDDHIAVLGSDDHLRLEFGGPMSVATEIRFDDVEYADNGYVEFYRTVGDDRVQTGEMDAALYGAIGETIEEALDAVDGE